MIESCYCLLETGEAAVESAEEADWVRAGGAPTVAVVDDVAGFLALPIAL